MKKILVSLSGLLVFTALFSLTSCKKEVFSNGTQFRASIEDCTSQNGKTSLSGNSLNWQNGDHIAVYGTAGCGFYSATLQENATTAVFDNVSGETGNPTFHAFYPATLTTDGENITLPATQTYVENNIHEFPMYAESNNNTLEFKNLCGLLKLQLTAANINISQIAITIPDVIINGTYSVSYRNSEPQIHYLSGGSSTTTLTCASPLSLTGGKVFYIYLPAGSYTGLKIEIITNDGRHCVATANTTISVVRSQYTPVDLTLTSSQFLPIGSKGGLFTINEAGTQVWFSQGNLQYNASTNIWRFADNQYTILPENAGGWIDRFGWGTGNNPTLNSVDYADYGNFVDWGVNAISNGGNLGNIWHTLSTTEWAYLVGSRDNAESKVGFASIGGNIGLVLLPDSWTLPDGCTFTHYAYPVVLNEYTTTQWAAMEANGALFLPAGTYWSSTPFSAEDYPEGEQAQIGIEIVVYQLWDSGDWDYYYELVTNWERFNHYFTRLVYTKH